MELDGTLSPSKGERVPKAGEGAVQGFKARTRSGNSLTEGEQGDRLDEYGSDLPAGVAADEQQRRSQALSRRGRRRSERPAAARDLRRQLCVWGAWRPTQRVLNNLAAGTVELSAVFMVLQGVRCSEWSSGPCFIVVGLGGGGPFGALGRPFSSSRLPRARWLRAIRILTERRL
jgi:hypothetical protein